MKALILSDIHSNIVALRAVWEAESGVDAVLCAGDLVDYGVFPLEVLEFARDQHFQVVQGNHDRHMANIYRITRLENVPPQDWKWVHDNCLKLREEHISCLEGLPIHLSFELDGYAYLMQHQFGPAYETVESERQFRDFWNLHASPQLRDHPRKRMIFGHTHRRCIHILGDGMEWINPGSVSYRRPDDPDKRAHYAVVENGAVSLRSVPYDHETSLEAALDYHRRRGMMETELQDAFFFFADAPTSRSPLPPLEEDLTIKKE